MAIIIKITPTICVGLLMGKKRIEKGKTCDIFELQKTFQSNFIFSDKAT